MTEAEKKRKKRLEAIERQKAAAGTTLKKAITDDSVASKPRTPAKAGGSGTTETDSERRARWLRELQGSSVAGQGFTHFSNAPANAPKRYAPVTTGAERMDRAAAQREQQRRTYAAMADTFRSQTPYAVQNARIQQAGSDFHRNAETAIAQIMSERGVEEAERQAPALRQAARALNVLDRATTSLPYESASRAMYDVRDAMGASKFDSMPEEVQRKLLIYIDAEAADGGGLPPEELSSWLNTDDLNRLVDVYRGKGSFARPDDIGTVANIYEDQATMYDYMARLESMPATQRQLFEQMMNMDNSANDYLVARENLASYMGGHKELDRLISAYQRYQNEARVQQEQADFQRRVEEAPGGVYAENLATPFYTVGAAITEPVGIAGEWFSRLTGASPFRAGDPNAEFYKLSDRTSMVRGATSDAILGDSPNLGRKVANTLYSGAMSALDNGARLAAGLITGNPYAALALAGTGSFSSSYRDAAARGADPLRAGLYGGAKAALEIVTEKIPLDRLLTVNASGLKGKLVDILLTSPLTEIGEEEASYFGGLLADAIIMGQSSNNQIQLRQLMESGMSEAEAREAVFNGIVADALETAATSYVSSGFMTGTKYAFGGRDAMPMDVRPDETLGPTAEQRRQWVAELRELSSAAQGEVSAAEGREPGTISDSRTVPQGVETAQDDGVRYSYAGRQAATADMGRLAQAEQLEQQGKSNEEIRQETGWFRGIDGQWRFEIDDSSATVHEFGDAIFSEKQGVKRRQELLEKELLGSISEDEQKELDLLDETYGGEVWRLSDLVRDGDAYLPMVLKHDVIYRAYPELSKVRIQITDDLGGSNGSYDGKRKMIQVLSYLPDFEKKATILHELQHAIQDIEGFTPGASPGYWKLMTQSADDWVNESILRNRAKNLIAQMDKLGEESGLNAYLDELFEKTIAEEITEDEEAALERKYIQEHVPEYATMQAELDDIYHRLKGISARKKDVNALYRNTAGEIEARDTAARRNLTAEERKKTPPDLGDENTVFVERPSGSIRFSTRGAGNGIIKSANGQDYSSEYVYRRVAPGEGVLSKYTGYGMFSDDANATEMYGEDLFGVDKRNLADIGTFKQSISDSWETAKKSGTLPPDLEDAYGEYTGAEIADMFDPENIVDSAGAWDEPALATWVYETGVFDDVPGVKTHDGGILFDETIALRMYPDSDIIGAKSGDSRYLRFSTRGSQQSAQTATRTTRLAAGKVTFDGDESKLTKTQKTNMAALRVVAEAMNAPIHVYESKVDPETGKRIGANGWYDPKDGSIHIDLHAGADGAGTMIFTASHELVHLIRDRSAKNFEALAGFLADAYGSDMDTLVEKQMDTARNNGRTISRDTAFEEVVASSMETMLTDKAVIQKLQQLRNRNRSVWQTIRDYFVGLVQKIRKVYKGLTPESEESNMAKSMLDKAVELRRLFMDGLEAAADGISNGTVETGRDSRYSAISEQQEAFFSQSVVRDDKGRLKPVYHGSKAKFTEFDLRSAGKNGTLNGVGYYFTDDEEYARGYGKDGETYEVYLDIKKPLSRTSLTLSQKQVESFLGKLAELFKGKGQSLSSFAFRVGDKSVPGDIKTLSAALLDQSSSDFALVDAVARKFINNMFQNKETGEWEVAAKDVYQALREATGYDGVVVPGRDQTHYVAFNPDQIKLVDNRAPTMSRDMRYSGRKTDPAQKDKTTAQLEAENRKLRESLEITRELLKLQGKVTGGKVIRQTSVATVARDLMQKTGAKGSTKDLTDLLTPLYTYIASGDGLTWDGIVEAAAPAVRWIQENTPVTLDPYAADVLSSLKGRKVSLKPTQKQEIISQYGTMADFRRALSGTVVISDTDATPIDSFFAEMSSIYPDLFREDLSDAGLGLELIDIVDRLQNMASADSQEAAYYATAVESDLTRQIYEGYWDVAPLKTVADKYQAKVNDLVGRYRSKMDAIRVANKEEQKRLRQQIATQRKELSRQSAKTLKLEKAVERKDAAIRARADRDKERRATASDSKNRTALRQKIANTVKELNSLLLNGKKDRNVPIWLQKPVAELLDAIDMDTVVVEKKLAALQKKLADPKINSDPEKVKKTVKSIEYWERVGGKVADRLSALTDAYRKIKESSDPAIASGYDENVEAYLNQVKESVGDTPIAEMTADQLELVYRAVKMTMTAVRNANKSFKRHKGLLISGMVAQVTRELRPYAEGGKMFRSEAGIAASKAHWNNYKPIFAFRRIGSKMLTELYESMRYGEDVSITDIHDAHVFKESVVRKYGADKWDFEKKFEFTTLDGKRFSLTLDEVFTMYAYSKRGKQATDHLIDGGGGFVFDKQVSRKVEGKTGKQVSTDYTAYGLDIWTFDQIITTLSDEQRAFADDMQKYLSEVMGAKGNEVSEQLYGIDLFGEGSYFPIITAKEYMAKSKDQERGEAKLKNMGFTKATQPEARNPVVLRPFTEVWAEHVVQMGTYHGLVLPMEDFYRVYGRTQQVQGGDESVQALLGSAYGPAAIGYIDQLLKDINGSTKSDSRAELMNKLISMHKKASTMASLSVLVQQRTSQARAWAVIEPKYFSGKPLGIKAYDQLREEMMQNAPIARIKSIGAFDTGVGRSFKEYILKRDYVGFKGVLNGIFTDSDFRNELLGKLASLADEQTWVAIYRAASKKALAEGGHESGSEGHKRATKEIFTQCVTMTQVYDSVFARSGFLRSKDTAVKMAVSFFNEPTVIANMVEDAIRQGKRGDKKYARRALGATITSVLINGAASALVYATRDDDDDQNYWEKYIEALTGNVLDSFNPVTYIPFARDIMSLLDGYSVDRADMTIPENLIKAFNKVFSDNKTVSAYDRFVSGAGAILDVFGIPLKNIERDLSSLWNTFTADTGEKTIGIPASIREGLPGWLDKIVPDTSTENGVMEAYQAGIYGWDKAEKALNRLQYLEDKAAYTDNELHWIQKKWDTGLNQSDHIDLAVLSGDAVAMDSASEELKAYSENPPKNPLKSSILRVYKDSLKPTDERNEVYGGKTLTREQAYKLLTEVAGLRDYEAYTDLERAEYAAKNGDDTGFSVYSGVFEAMVNGGDVAAMVDKLVKAGFAEDKVLSETKGKVTQAYKDGQLSKSQVTAILKKYYGMTEKKELYQYFGEADYEAQGRGESYSAYNEVYASVAKGGDISAQVKLLTQNGYTEQEVYQAAFTEAHRLYNEGEISSERAQELMRKYCRTTENLSAAEKRKYYDKYGKLPENGALRELTEDELYWKWDEWRWKKENPDKEYSKYQNWYAAIESGENLRQVARDYDSHGVTKSTLSRMISDRYKQAYLDAYFAKDSKEASRIRKMLVKAYISLGYSSNDAYEQLKEWVEAERKYRR